MEKELNIAAILKEKPKDTRLHDVARNVTVLFQEIDEYENIKCSLIDGLILEYTNTGSMYQFPTGMEVLKPSKEMQDWSKFAWKKGDVLRYSDILVIFEKWTKDDYTEFKAAYEFNCHSNFFDEENIYYTSEFCKAIDEVADNFIKKVEEHYGGKLNLETLEIEKPMFKDGDIVYSESTEHNYSSIFIAQDMGNYLSAYVSLREDNQLIISKNSLGLGLLDGKMRPATDSEKQQLFAALRKEGKRWNPDTKQIEDLPKKCELKPFDKVLVRDTDAGIWMPTLFGFYDEEFANYVCLNETFQKCIPYNDKTKHLLGTTGEWKGGEG